MTGISLVAVIPSPLSAASLLFWAHGGELAMWAYGSCLSRATSLAFNTCADTRDRNFRNPEVIVCDIFTREGTSILTSGLRGTRDAQMTPKQISTIAPFSAGAKNQAASARNLWLETR